MTYELRCTHCTAQHPLATRRGEIIMKPHCAITNPPIPTPLPSPVMTTTQINSNTCNKQRRTTMQQQTLWGFVSHQSPMSPNTPAQSQIVEWLTQQSTDASLLSEPATPIRTPTDPSELPNTSNPAPCQSTQPFNKGPSPRPVTMTHGVTFGSSPNLPPASGLFPRTWEQSTCRTLIWLQLLKNYKTSQ